MQSKWRFDLLSTDHYNKTRKGHTYMNFNYKLDSAAMYISRCRSLKIVEVKECDLSISLTKSSAPPRCETHFFSFHHELVAAFQLQSQPTKLWLAETRKYEKYI